MEEKKARETGELRHSTSAWAETLDPRGPGGNGGGGGETRSSTRSPCLCSSSFSSRHSPSARKGGVPNKPVWSACDRQIHVLPGDVEPSKGPRNKQHCPFPSPVSRRVLHHHSHPPAMQPASEEAAGLRARGRSQHHGEWTEQQRQRPTEPPTRSPSFAPRKKDKRNLRRNLKKNDRASSSPCRSAIVVRKIASPPPSNTLLRGKAQNNQLLAGVLQCNGSTSPSFCDGASPREGCIQGTEHASSARRRRPPASCARCDRLRPACRRRPLPLRCGWLGCAHFLEGGFYFGFLIGWLVGRSQTFAGVVGGVQAFLTDDVV